MADKQLSQWYRKAYQDFSGGLNDFESPLIVKQNQFTQLDNALVNNRSLLEKAEGYALDGSPFPGSAACFPRMMTNYRRGAAVDKLIVCGLDTGNTNATYKVDIKETDGTGTYDYVCHTTGTAAFTNGNTAVVGTSTSWLSRLKTGDKIKSAAHTDAAYAEILSVNSDTSITLTAAYSGATVAATTYKARIILHKDYVPQAVVFNNNCVITNGSDKMMTYNNSTINTITDTDAPRALFIESHKNRIFAATTTNLYWSAINDETSWDAAGFEPIFPNDGGSICAIKSFGDSLLVFKDAGRVYQVVGSFDQDAVGYVDYMRKLDIPSNIGNIAGYTPVVHDDNKIYFLAQTGWYALDGRGILTKASWNAEDTTSSIAIRPSTTAAKSYAYDSKTQWDVGTHSGTVSRTAGNLEPFFDQLAITDAKKGHLLCSTAIDSNNDVHIAYVSNTDDTKIRYKKWSASDNSVSIDETIQAGISGGGTNLIASLSIAVSSTGNVAIVNSMIKSPLGVSIYSFQERVSGTWSASTQLHSVSVSYDNMNGVAVKYKTTGNDCGVILPVVHTTLSSTNIGAKYMKRLSGVWASIASSPYGDIFGRNSPVVDRVCLQYNTSDDVYVLGWGGASAEYLAYKSTDDGASWSLIENFTAAVTTGNFVSTHAQLSLSSNDAIMCYVDSSGVLKKRNMTTATTTTLDNTLSSGAFCGYASYNSTIGATTASRDYALTRTGSPTAERFLFENSTLVTNSTTNVLDTTYVGNPDCLRNNGPTFATAFFGANVWEIIVRRVAFRGVYTTNENFDSTLSAWSTYVVDSQSAASSTITHEVALNTVSPATNYSTITTGSVISANPALSYAKARITFVMGGFSGPNVGSITMNYTGAGVDGRLPVGTLYKNELYLSMGTDQDSANTQVLVRDMTGAYSTRTYPVTMMCWYKGMLYGGSSTTGDVYKLITGYRALSSAYTLTAVSKEDLLGSLELDKEVYKIYVIYETKASGTFTFSYRLDNYRYSTGSSWTDAVINQTSDGIAEVDVMDSCKSIQCKVVNSTIDNEVGIIGWVIVYGYKNLR